jgi:hypothetical protein
MKIFFLCPVPEDQKPINEYIGLKENFLTNWTTLSFFKYIDKIFFFFLFFFSLNFFFSHFSVLFAFFSFLIDFVSQNFTNNSFSSFSSFPSFSFLLEQIVETFLFSFLFFLFVFFVLFFRWQQLKIRFNQSRFIYEESSWYDVQIWEKPLLLIKNERLMTTQKIQPILKRLFQTISFALFLLFSLFFLFF